MRRPKLTPMINAPELTDETRRFFFEEPMPGYGGAGRDPAGDNTSASSAEDAIVTIGEDKKAFEMSPAAGDPINHGSLLDDVGGLDVFLDNYLKARPKNNAVASPPPNRSETDGAINQLVSALMKVDPDADTRTVGATVRPPERPVGRLEFGTVIADRFEVGVFIKSGGFGHVYKGYHRKLDREIAIKILRKELMDDPRMVERFYREAKIMASINHPNVVRIFDVGEEESFYFLVMEYVRGANLDDYLRTQGKLEFATAYQMMTDIASALAVIHQQSIVHRDIKPSNIMVDENGDPKLMDFGISKTDTVNVATPPDDLTSTGTVLGSPLYMSPEQFNTPDKVSCASDIYSLGLTYYQMLTGLQPISEVQMARIRKRQCAADPYLAQQIGRTVPGALSRVLSTMVSAEPEKRYQNGGEVKAALERVKTSRIRRALVVALGVLAVGSFALYARSHIGLPQPTSENAYTHAPGNAVADTSQPITANHNTEKIAFAMPPANKIDHWISAPRIYSVLPFGSPDDESRTYFSDYIVTHLTTSGHDIVERERVDAVIAELKLKSTDFPAADTAVRVGRLVGAHIIITGNISRYNGADRIIARAFDVETTEVLASAILEPDALDDVLRTMTTTIADRMVFRSYIVAADSAAIQIQHGRRHGARQGMKLRVMDDAGETAAVVAIEHAEVANASARIRAVETDIQPGMRVEEIKDRDVATESGRQ